jgi:Ca2+-binding EF-hand superfamily protein
MKAHLAMFAIVAQSWVWAQLPFSGFDHDDDLLLSPREMELATEEFVSGIDAFQATVMERFDSDGDGALNAAERKPLAAGNTNLGGLAQRFDRDSDGMISPDERGAAVQDFYERLATQNRDTMARFDANKDGVISADERGGLEINAADVLSSFGRADTFGRGGFGGRAERPRVPDWVTQNDRDGDFLIDEVEEWFAMEVFRETMRERVSRQLDTDRDGEVSDDEIAGFIAESWREGREDQAHVTLQRLQGVVDTRIWQPVQARVAEWNAGIRKRFDADADGWLNEAEAKAAAEQLR